MIMASDSAPGTYLRSYLLNRCLGHCITQYQCARMTMWSVMEVAVMRVVNDHHVGLVYHPLDLMNRFKVGEQLLNPHPLQTKICIHIGGVGICQHHGYRQLNEP